MEVQRRLASEERDRGGEMLAIAVLMLFVAVVWFCVGFLAGKLWG